MTCCLLRSSKASLVLAMRSDEKAWLLTSMHLRDPPTLLSELYVPHIDFLTFFSPPLMPPFVEGERSNGDKETQFLLLLLRLPLW